MPSNPTTTAGIEAVDYEYVQSCGAHGVHAHGQFDAFVGSQREIWIGSDGSGLIRETSGPASFFTEDGRARWEAADSRELTHGPSVDLFAPGCLHRAPDAPGCSAIPMGSKPLSVPARP